MKKLLATLFAIGLIFTVTGAAIAGGPKPPKNLCFQAAPNGGAYFLGIKKGNKVLAGSLKIDMYTVQGIIGNFYPVSGTGYMNGELFIFQLNTSSAESQVCALGAWNVVTEAGSMDFNSSADAFESITYDLLPCGDI